MSTPMGSGSKGQLLAFRIVGWTLGAITILPSLFYIVISISSSDPADRIHRFHNLGGFAGIGLIGVFSVVLVLRPEWTAAFHVLVAATAAWIIGGLMGGDLISGLYVTAALGLVVLAALHPDPTSLRRLHGRPSIGMLIYALIATMPAWIYAVTMAELQHGPASDPHVQLHHWSGMAVAALSIAGAAIAASLRGEGWELAAAAAAAAAVLFGVAGLVFSHAAGAPPVGWSWVAIAAGVGFWFLTRFEASRERSAG
jgi:hypothetical protein